MTDAVGMRRDSPLYTPLNIPKKKVAYFYDSDIGNYAYVTGHPMKPHRIRLSHCLVMNYGVFKYLEVFRARPAVVTEMTQFHTDEYIEFLQRVTPDNMDSYMREQGKYNVGDDCPVFDGLFEFCGISAGGSMEGAARLNRNKCDIAINWAGGLHHAKKSEASGFCYVNDIVLAILELLRFNQRVLYIDIDVHHGDGVEEAFFTTDRVMTVSFHKYGEYFPGTGELRDIGIGAGKHYAVNFPLRDGIDDSSYETIFEPVISAVMQYYRPEAVVLQCGGDSLSGDRLGCFNLSMRGHANCVNFVRSFNLPTLVLGGGGYTMRNVARTWAYETGRLVGVEMDSVLPYNEYYDYYAPDYELDVRPSNMENANSQEYLEKIKIQVIDNLRKTAHAPSVQMQDVPRHGLGMSDDEEAEIDDEDADQNPDVRVTQRQWEKRVARDDEAEESEEEEMAYANGVQRPNGRKNRVHLDYRSFGADANSSDATPAPKDSAEEQPAAEANGVEVMMEDAEPQSQVSAEEPSKVNGAAPEPEGEADSKMDVDGDVAMGDTEDATPVEKAIKQEETEITQPTAQAEEDAKPKSPAAEPAVCSAPAQEQTEKETASPKPDNATATTEADKASVEATAAATTDGEKMDTTAADNQPPSAATADAEKKNETGETES